MADISGYIRNIEIASRGEEVRDSIVGALNSMNDSIEPSVEDALLDAKESGDFDGPKGDTGDTGPAGPFFTPSVSNEGVISWSNNGGLPNPSGVNIRGPKGDAGTDGARGSDGVSPVVSVTSITGGHRVTITDKDHPSGQSFDVMDGDDAPAGAMLTSVYDPDGDVAAAGGIAEYVAETAQGALTFDSAPTENSTNPVTSHGIYVALYGLINRIAALETLAGDLAARVTALEGGSYVEDNYLVANDGSVSGSVLELRNASVKDNYTVIGGSGSGTSVEDNLLVLAGASEDSSILEISDSSVSGSMIDFED